MPCWYYDRREIEEMNNHGLDPKTVSRYSKEGPRFILDCGTKMGLRYETCATGVVYFHRFYLFRSFRDFNRHVTAACCLFLAGKVEETPKKCKDIIKVARGMLTDQQFASFGEDPREEVMTMERILLQTIKFDLQVEHPYSYLLKFAKILRGNDEHGRDKDKIQAMVQMAWTFINDSLCTLLCLQWEPDIIAVALMYLASRLKTFEISDGKGSQKGKWWNHLVEDITFDLLEDICHQVLDLYSSPQQNREESPPPPPPPKHPPAQQHKRSRSNTPSEAPDAHSRDRGAPPPSKMSRHEAPRRSKSPSPSPNKHDKSKQPHHPAPAHGTGTPVKSRPGGTATPPTHPPPHPSAPGGPGGSTGSFPRPDGVQYNPYMSSSMYGSSFMSGEGAQSIQSLMSGGSQGGSGPSTPVPQSGPPPTVPYGQPPPPSGSAYSQPQHTGYQAPPYQSYQQAPPPQSAPPYSQPPPSGPAPPYPPQSYQQPPPGHQPPPPNQQPPPPQQQQQQPPPPNYNQYQYPSYPNQPPSQNPPYPPPPQGGYGSQPPPPPQQYPQYPPAGAPPPPSNQYSQYAPQNQGYQQQHHQQGTPYKGGPPPPGANYQGRGAPPPPTAGLQVRITPRR